MVDLCGLEEVRRSAELRRGIGRHAVMFGDSCLSCLLGRGVGEQWCILHPEGKKADF